MGSKSECRGGVGSSARLAQINEQDPDQALRLRRRADHQAFLSQARQERESWAAHIGEQDYVPCKLFVGGLPTSCTEDMLSKHFAPFGRVEGIELKVKFAFVTFDDDESAQRALHQKRQKLEDGSHF